MVPWDSCILETGGRPYLAGREQSLSQKEVDIPSVYHPWKLLNRKSGKEDLEGALLPGKRGNSFLLLIP